MRRPSDFVVAILLLIAFVGSAGFIAYILSLGWINVGPSPRSRIMVEVGELSMAFQALYEKYQVHPPCLANKEANDRKMRFLGFLRTAFDHSNYGTTADDFDHLNSRVQNGFDGGPGYNFQDAASGQFIPLDLNRLDAAESLVFWLGGFPTPVDPATDKPVANRLIFGFHRDSDAPFKRDPEPNEAHDPLRYRTDTFYQFDETRLVDQDGDGWLEYNPRPQVGEKRVPPYVYFDAATYFISSQLADQLGTVCYPADGPLAQAWGQAVPYLQVFDPQQPTKAVWWHPESFQIHCAGLDGRYSAPPQPGSRRIVVMPEASEYHLPETMPRESDELLRDNLTNVVIPDTVAEPWRE